MADTPARNSQGELAPIEEQLSFDGLPYLTGFAKAQFFERLYGLLLDTENYSGTLDEAFNTAVPLDNSGAIEESPEAAQTISDKQLREYARITSALTNAGVTTAVIEAAHVYAYESVDDPKLSASLTTQARHAGVITNMLEAAGIQTKQIVFVDEYNSDGSGDNTQRLDLGAYLALVQSAGFRPDYLLREGAMVPLARQMLSVMREQGIVEYDPPEGADNPDARVLLSYRKHELYRGSDQMYTCAMLDAALSMVKLRHLGEAVINILPQSSPGGGFSYNGQQRKMRSIIREHLRLEIIPIANLFVGDESESVSAGTHHGLRKPRN